MEFIAKPTDQEGVFEVTNTETGEVKMIDRNSEHFASLPMHIQLAVLYALEKGQKAYEEQKEETPPRQPGINDYFRGGQFHTGKPDWLHQFNENFANHSPSGFMQGWDPNPGPTNLHWIRTKYPHLSQQEVMQWLQRGYDPFADGWEPGMGAYQGEPQVEQQYEQPAVEQTAPDASKHAPEESVFRSGEESGLKSGQEFYHPSSPALEAQFGYKNIQSEDNLSENVLMRMGKAIVDEYNKAQKSTKKSGTTRSGAASVGGSLSPAMVTSAIKKAVGSPKSTVPAVHGPSNRSNKNLKPGPSGYLRGGM